MRTKTAKIKRIHNGPICGEGSTLADAKADLAAKVAAALDGDYSPAIINHCEYSAVVHRSPDGWAYTMSDGDRPLAPPGIRHVCGMVILSGETDRRAAIQSAAAHLVGLDGVDYRSLDELPDWLTDREARENILTTRRFHRAYQWAKSNKPDGRDDDWAWHDWAGSHYRDEQFA